MKGRDKTKQEKLYLGKLKNKQKTPSKPTINNLKKATRCHKKEHLENLKDFLKIGIKLNKSLKIRARQLKEGKKDK